MAPTKQPQHEPLGASFGQERVSPAKMTLVPSRGTKNRTIRIADDMWVPFSEARKKQGLTPSEVVRDCIRAYIENHEGDNDGGQGVSADNA